MKSLIALLQRVTRVTGTITFKGHPQDGGQYTQYNVLRNDEIIGCILPGGFFRSRAKTKFTGDEKEAIRAGCRKVHRQPSEYGCFGSGDPPTEPFDEKRCGI
jgi:hypothetical protein